MILTQQKGLCPAKTLNLMGDERDEIIQSTSKSRSRAMIEQAISKNGSKKSKACIGQKATQSKISDSLDANSIMDGLMKLDV